MVASDPAAEGLRWIVSLHAVTCAVILSISTKALPRSCLVIYQTALIGLADVTNTQSGSATPDCVTTNKGSQPSIQSASRTGHSKGNTRDGSAMRCCV